jgi:hypothetical protein
MIHFFKKFLYLSFLLTIFTYPFYPLKGRVIKGNPPSIESLLSEEEEEALLDTLDPDLLEAIDFNNLKAICPDDFDIVSLLLELNAPQILQNDLYKQTNLPNTRDLHSLPSLQPFFERTTQWGIGAQFFANITSQMYFTKCSPFISSYLAFDNGDFLEQIDNKFFPTIDIPDIISLFSTIKLQERRIGALISLFRRYKAWSFMVVLPIYYLEHNFFLTEEEIDEISINPLFRSIPSGSDDTATQQMIACHLVNDSAGIGDLRFTVQYDLSSLCNLKAILGLDFIAPTAHAFKKGIIGNNFPLNAPIPPFSIREIFDLFCKGQNNQIINDSKAFLIGALDRLTTNVADSRLGSHHFSLRPFIEYKKPFTNRLSLASYASVQPFFTRQDIRFFITATTPEEFNRDFKDPDQATANLDFLNQAFIETLYTFPVCLKVKPGLEARFAVSLIWESKDFSVAFGYDFWHKNAERFIKVPSEIAQKFVLSQGLKSSAQQSKLFTHIFAHHSHSGLDTWHVGLRGDITVTHKGIGRDFTLAMDAIIDF